MRINLKTGKISIHALLKSSRFWVLNRQNHGTSHHGRNGNFLLKKRYKRGRKLLNVPIPKRKLKHLKSKKKAEDMRLKKLGLL